MLVNHKLLNFNAPPYVFAGERWLGQISIKLNLLNFMCSPTARTKEGVRANINQTWALNNPQL